MTGCTPTFRRSRRQSLQALRERLAWLSGRRAPEGNALWLNWVMRGAADGAYIGRVQATVRSDAPAYLAYEVFPAHWHQGYATEACTRMIRWLIDELQHRTLHGRSRFAERRLRCACSIVWASSARRFAPRPITSKAAAATSGRAD